MNLNHLSVEKNQWKRKFFTVASGQVISLIGSSAVQFSLIWWLTTETSSALMLSLAGIFAYLPYIFLGPFVGVWIDRWRRKVVVIAADLFQGILAAAFALWFLLGEPPYWSVCVMLGLRGLGSVFHTPAVQALIPLLVPSDKLVNANGWVSFMQSGAFMLGPVLGALMYAVLPLWIILLSDLFGAIVASVAMAVVKVAETRRDPTVRNCFFRELKVGLKVFFCDRPLGVTAIVSFLCMLFFVPISTLYPLMTGQYFHGTSFHAGLVEFGYAAGMMLSSLALGIFGRIRKKLFFVNLGLLTMGCTALICGMLPATTWAFAFFVLLCSVMGAGGNLYSIPFASYIQETVSPETQGRVFSLVGSAMSLSMPAGLALAGPLAERYGINFWFLVSGIICCLLSIVSMLISRGIKNNHKIC